MMNQLRIVLMCLVVPMLSWADFSNIATATYTDSLSTPYNATSNTVTVTVVGTPAIVLTKSADKTTATSGTVVTYTIQYQNNGAGNASSVVIRDSIPTGTTLVPGSITAGGTVSAGTITWSIGTVNALAAARSVSFQVTVN